LTIPIFLNPDKVKTKAISDDKNPAEDGIRFLVVSPILQNGVVDGKLYFRCLEELVPSKALLRQWKDRKINYSQFALEYKKELAASSNAQNTIQELQELVKQGKTITLLCHEQEFRRDCHRHTLSDVLMGVEREYDSHYDMTEAEILSYIPRQKRLIHQLRLEAELEAIKANHPPKCYYCNGTKFKNKSQYQKHVLGIHSGKLCYPGAADIKDYWISLNAKHCD
jgi:uncharacterized protein YeaO (DUF488 family)